VLGQTGEQRNITSEQKPWTPKALETVKFFRNYTAGLSPKADQVWAVRSLESSSNQSSACYARPGFKGLISTNATAYSSGPPTLARGILNYSLAAPSQYVGAIEEIDGSYDLVMSRAFASCVYGGREVSARASVSVTPKNLTITYTALDKVYDGKALAVVSASSSDVLGNDQLAFQHTSAAFASPNVLRDGSSLAVTQVVSVSGLSLSGADGANYSLQNTVANTSAKINPKDIHLESITAAGKTYDGNDIASITSVTLKSTDFVGNETVT
jgi:hypothetical protein